VSSFRGNEVRSGSSAASSKIPFCVMIHFPRKRYLSVSTTLAIWTRDRGAKKLGNLKDFEVCVIHKKEPWDK
jgi:hypothetical protein